MCSWCQPSPEGRGLARCPDALHREADRVRGYFGGTRSPKRSNSQAHSSVPAPVWPKRFQSNVSERTRAPQSANSGFNPPPARGRTSPTATNLPGGCFNLNSPGGAYMPVWHVCDHGTPHCRSRGTSTSHTSQRSCEKIKYSHHKGTKTQRKGPFFAVLSASAPLWREGPFRIYSQLQTDVSATHDLRRPCRATDSGDRTSCLLTGGIR
jgi:hypothetical protein